MPRTILEWSLYIGAGVALGVAPGLFDLVAHGQGVYPARSEGLRVDVDHDGEAVLRQRGQLEAKRLAAAGR